MRCVLHMRMMALTVATLTQHVMSNRRTDYELMDARSHQITVLEEMSESSKLDNKCHASANQALESDLVQLCPERQLKNRLCSGRGWNQIHMPVPRR